MSEPTMSSSMEAKTQPKMWKDISAEEKIERTREQIKYLLERVRYIANQIQTLENELKNHDHLNGKIVKDIKTNMGILSGTSKLLNPEAEAKGEVYF